MTSATSAHNFYAHKHIKCDFSNATTIFGGPDAKSGPGKMPSGQTYLFCSSSFQGFDESMTKDPLVYYCIYREYKRKLFKGVCTFT